MAHVRKQVRDAIVTALTGLATTGSRVYASRVYDLETLPALKIYTLTESKSFETMGYARRIKHLLGVVVEGHAKVNDTLDNTLDLIAAEVQTVMEAAADPADNLGGLVEDIYCQEDEITLESGAENPSGVIKMLYVAEYHTLEGDPETVLA